MPCGDFCCKFFQKTVDKRPCGWYNYTRRQARGQTSGGLAQLGERLHGMQEVTGSIPVISTRNKKHRTEMCGAFFVNAERVRVSLLWESAVHGLQEGHRDQNRRGILHQKEKALHGKRVVLFSFTGSRHAAAGLP